MSRALHSLLLSCIAALALPAMPAGAAEASAGKFVLNAPGLKRPLTFLLSENQGTARYWKISSDRILMLQGDAPENASMSDESGMPLTPPPRPRLNVEIRLKPDGRAQVARVIFTDDDPVHPLAAHEQDVLELQPDTLPLKGKLTFTMKARLKRGTMNKSGRIVFAPGEKETLLATITFTGTVHPRETAVPFSWLRRR